MHGVCTCCLDWNPPMFYVLPAPVHQGENAVQYNNNAVLYTTPAPTAKLTALHVRHSTGFIHYTCTGIMLSPPLSALLLSVSRVVWVYECRRSPRPCCGHFGAHGTAPYTIIKHCNCRQRNRKKKNERPGVSRWAHAHGRGAVEVEGGSFPK